MMNERIWILPPILANQLAAGEVIERPASIVKELVENSLDAGSTELTIQLEQGGIKRIVVTDNGSGIHPEDLPLAFARHATSKIKAAADLSQIASLGFRGEALASIGSVAKLRMASRWGEEPAHEVRMNPAQDVSLQLCSHPPGTTVEVQDLFYNTPARKKFLKSSRTEWLHIEDLIKRLSLSRPDVSWHIYHEGKLVNRYIAKPRDIRLQQVLGKAFMEAGLAIDSEITQVKLSGVVARPEFARSSADYQFFYVNGRMVKDRVISHAIRMAYEDTVYPGRHPAYVLYCDMDHSLVDVNVHPTKHEVRFVHARMVHDFINETLRATLSHQPVKEARAVDSVLVIENKVEAEIAQAVLPTFQARVMGTPLGKVIACVGERVVLTQDESWIYAIDWQKSLQQYIRTRWQAGLEAGDLVTRPILMPVSVVLRDERWPAKLTALGFELQAVDATHYLIRGMPACLQGLSSDVLSDVVMQLPEDPLSAFVKAYVQMCSQVSQRNLAQIELLLTEMIAFGGEKSLSYKRHSPETLIK